MPVELWPVMQHRMDSYRNQKHKWWGSEVSEELVTNLMAEIADRGASTARDLDDGLPRAKEHWGWNWSATKRALDYLYMTGEVAIAGRNSQFEVSYDLPERVLPADVLAAADADASRRPTSSSSAGRRGPTAWPRRRCLADYYRMQPRRRRRPAARAPSRSSSRRASSSRCAIEGWNRPAYLHRDARRPRRVDARALLSPFDPVVWLRERTEKLFDFHYRIEIYTPAPQAAVRLLRAAVPARRGDRRPRRPQGRPAVGSPGREGGVRRAAARRSRPPRSCRAELVRLAGWLGMDELTVEPRGDLAPLLRP